MSHSRGTDSQQLNGHVKTYMDEMVTQARAQRAAELKQTQHGVLNRYFGPWIASLFSGFSVAEIRGLPPSKTLAPRPNAAGARVVLPAVEPKGAKALADDKFRGTTYFPKPEREKQYEKIKSSKAAPFLLKYHHFTPGEISIFEERKEARRIEAQKAYENRHRWYHVFGFWKKDQKTINLTHEAAIRQKYNIAPRKPRS